MLLGELLALVERMAPFGLAQEWDNSGLQVGDDRSAVKRILVALEVNEAVASEAVSEHCDTILVHHPLLFKPVRTLVASNPKERLLRRLVTEDVAVIACHTNVDAAAGGLADIVGSALGLVDMEPLEPAAAGWHKLVAYVPEASLAPVEEAVFAAGAGGIGRYSECSFRVAGEGRFTPREGSRPALGTVGVPERVAEVRWETVIPRGRLGAALKALITAHPYEEPAFDVYPVEDVLPGVGIGRVGSLPEARSVRALASGVAGTFGAGRVSWSGPGEQSVQRIAVLPGSGRGSIMAAAGRCDLLVTGDLSYHDAETAAEAGLTLIDVPHGEIEWWAFQRWSENLASKLEDEAVDVKVSTEWRSSWETMAKTTWGKAGRPTSQGGKVDE